LRFSRKQQDRSVPKFFQGLGENTCSLQPSLKSTATGLYMSQDYLEKSSSSHQIRLL